MFRPLEKLIHAYFARTWPIATCKNQLDVINGGLIPILRMGASRHQIPHRLPAHDSVLAFLIETPHPASKDPSASVSDELRQDPGSG